MDQPPASSDRPVLPLQYAHPRTAADEQSNAEAAIMAGAALAGYRRYFRHTRDAVRFYGEFQSRRFARGTVDQICKGCGAPTANVARIDWRFVIPMRTMEFGMSTEGNRAFLQTHHSLCDECFRRTALRVQRFRRRRAGAIALGVIGVILLIQSGRMPSPIGSWCAVLSLGLVVLTMLFVKLILRPPPLPPALQHVVAGTFENISRIP